MSEEYKEKLKELLYDPDEQKDSLKERILNEMTLSQEESELKEIRKILAKINEDKTVIDPETGSIKLLDISQGILLKCERCNSWQPFEIRQGWKDEIWFYCTNCGWPRFDFEMRRNI